MAERMSERAEDDVTGEQQQRRAAAGRQQRRQQQQGESSSAAAMAAGGDRTSLPSPGAMLGQPWAHWVEAVKLHGLEELEESWKECDKKRESMRLSREDMAIFGLCPAYDEFYLVMCSHCNQVIKPQAFQSHYERRHSSINKTPVTPPSSSTNSLYSTVSSKTKPSGGGSCSSTRPSSGSSASSNSKLMKSPKDKLPIGGSNKSVHPVQHSKAPQEKIMTPSVKVEKMHPNPKIDGVLKSTAGPACSSTVSSSIKTGLNCPSIPKPPLPSPGQIPNGKGILSTTPFSEKKPDDTNNRKYLHKRLSDREFDPDIHCGVVDVETKKPCTRSLTCKTHSLGYRRAVQGRKKRFDVLLAEHKNKTREKELLRHSEHQQQAPALREPHPVPSKSSQELHQNSHGLTSPEAKPSITNKAKPHNPSLPRPSVYPATHSGNAPSDSPSVHESPQPVVSAAEPTCRFSSDEGEGDEKEESAEKLDCHYSDHHPRPAAYCTFGSRQIGRGYYVFDKRWDHIRCALNFMVDKHLNSQMWRKIPPASSNSSAHAPHRTSTNATSASHSVNSTGFLSPCTVTSPPASATSPCASLDKVSSHGTTLNAHPVGASDSVSSMQSRQVSSSPSTPSVLSPLLSPHSNKPQKLKTAKSLKPKETPASSTNCSSASSNSSSSGGGGGSGKKRKTSSPPQLLAHPPHSAESIRKNCALNSGTYHSPTTNSSQGSSHGIGLNFVNSKSNSVSLKHDQSGRGPPTGNPAESIKRMSVVMNSSDSTLSLGPFVHQAGEQTVNSQNSFSHSHASLDKLMGKKRRCSPGTSSITTNNSKSSKVAKLPPVNNVHAKHNNVIAGTQALTNNSLRHQPKARP
ncbi:ataxin-7 isoform X2 [Xenopus tropicalis]|uniref:Ataxin-7 isoform X2 n=1 Tax=Xenopus tropicalis TaxID=8364 RepID=A0A8J0SKH0_XENTR|nr:ataxin-7 isoform X2 [Xenopus tropicalis]|eukprot:XP_012815986.1 PREDICTED: ataxin-7 isoform X2 [Xenopus tropicalis]